MEENKLWKNGYKHIIGIDEVGRGAFAGPVVVGAVVLNKDNPYQGYQGIIPGEINDSKLLSPRNREILDKEIRKCAQFYSIAEVGVSVINKVGIGKATKIAFRKVVKSIICNENQEIQNSKYQILNTKYFMLVDGFHIKYIKGIGLKNQKAIIKGDRKSISIAAASIIAKVYRDKLMKDLAKKYREYHFEDNKGYGTKEHQIAIKKYGLSRIHRKSFNLKKFQ